MRKALTIAVLPTLLFLLLLVPAPSGAATPTTAEKQVLSLVNAQRAKRGLPAVQFQNSLILAARGHSREMARRGVLTHSSANGDGVGQRLLNYGYKRAGYRSWSVGENIAYASKAIAAPGRIVSMWMKSEGHRAVMLKRSFRDAGVGIAASSRGLRYYSLDMGRRIR